jgi:phosphoglycerate dehydrogenase-like enzyme
MMSRVNLLVLADPAQPQLKMLEQLRETAAVTVGNTLQAVEPSASRADVVFAWSGHRDLLEQIWHTARQIKWVHSMAAGLDNLLFAALVESPVPLTNSRGVFSQSLAEFVMGAVLFFAKDFRRMVRNQEAGIWQGFDVDEISRQSLGIIGYGDIGRAVARRAKAFDMKVLGLRRRPEQSRSDSMLDQILPLERKLELMAGSDYVVVAAPLTPDTRGMIGTAELRAMKKTGVLINVGRGPVVDEPALIRALQEKWIRGAALDVFENEPLPPGHPFYRLDSVLLSPHCADHTSDWMEQATQFFLDNFERFRKGEPLQNVVDKRFGY